MRQLFLGIAIALAITFSPILAEAGNQKMVESVANMLQTSDLAEGCDIGLKYQNNTIWLTGTVPSEAKRIAIEACVFHVKGVDKVVNELVVVPNAALPDNQAADTIQDAEVQAAAYQRSILRNGQSTRRSILQQPILERPVFNRQDQNCKSCTQAEGRPIGEDVVFVEPINSMNAPALPPNAVMVPANPGAVPAPHIIAATPPMVQATPYQAVGNGYAARPSAPVRAINYGTVTAAPVAAHSMVYNVSSTPLPMNAPAYAPRHNGPAMRYDKPHLPRHAWPSYASYPNTAAVQYPKRYSAKAWPFIGPFYPYPQVPDAWRKVSLEWHDGYWHLDFDDGTTKGPCRGLFRMNP